MADTNCQNSKVLSTEKEGGRGVKERKGEEGEE